MPLEQAVAANGSMTRQSGRARQPRVAFDEQGGLRDQSRGAAAQMAKIRMDRKREKEEQAAEESAKKRAKRNETSRGREVHRILPPRPPPRAPLLPQSSSHRPRGELRGPEGTTGRHTALDRLLPWPATPRSRRNRLDGGVAAEPTFGPTLPPSTCNSASRGV